MNISKDYFLNNFVGFKKLLDIESKISYICELEIFDFK